MERRQFLAGGLTLSAALMAPDHQAMAQSPSSREFYLLRRYALRSGPQLALTENYFSQALIPALNRMGMSHIGAMKLDFGSETPAYYLLVPGSSLDTLAQLELRLVDDAEFMKLARPFWEAPAAQPAFERIESSLLLAFSGWPRLTPPAATAQHKNRIFQLRTYEGPSDADHVRKVAMFHDGEFDIFKKAGFAPVFFGETLIGSRIPNLTYMLAFADMAELSAKWDVFRTDPDWQKLSHSARYAYEPIVSNISNVLLSPLACSQI